MAAVSPSSPDDAPDTEPSLEQLQRAEKLREDGNAKFKVQDVDGAKGDYDKALACLDAAQKLSENNGSSCNDGRLIHLKTSRVPVLLNLALCCLRSDEGFRALQLCEEALDLEPGNTKAIFRKAKALMDLGELKEAEWELVRACKLNPKDAAVRKELEQLRQKFKDDKAKEKATFEGLFAKEPGFASDNRAASAVLGAMKKSDLEDIYFHDGKENPFEDCATPHLEAEKLQQSGELEDACQAWEAALMQTAGSGEWARHFEHCVEFGRLLMDLNLDRLAMRCFDKVMESCNAELKTENDVTVEPATPQMRQHAVLLRAICSLNEGENAEVEVRKHVRLWLDEVNRPLDDATPMEEYLLQWTDGGADAAVALGLLQLMSADASAPRTFATAVAAAQDDRSCFGSPCRLSTRWNMLGAVLANRKQYTEALVAYGQALQLQPNYPRALVNCGIANAAIGERLTAVDMYSIALTIAPRWSTDPMWAELQSIAGDQSDNEDLLEAAKQKNLTKLQELLKRRTSGAGLGSAESGSKAEPLAVLQHIGFTDL